MEYTEQEFNEAMARLDGHKVVKRPDGEFIIFLKGESIGELLRVFGNYYNDLNLLMPLAWKFGVYVLGSSQNDVTASNISQCTHFEDAIYSNVFKKGQEIEAIRDCLYQIAQERNK